MEIRKADLEDARVIALIETHVVEAHEGCPPESAHALGLDELKAPDVQVWTLWDGSDLLGCGALKRLNDADGEIKSMHTARRARGRGVARRILDHLLATAQAQGFEQVSLETGSYKQFEAARKLYEKAGFGYTGPFAGYVEDPLSVFMTKDLRG